MHKPAHAVRNIDRRQLLTSALGGTAALTALRSLAADSAAPATGGGRIKQSVCQWCYGKQTKTPEDREQFYAAVAALGIKGVDLTGPSDWPAMKKHGLVCSMVPSHGIGKGFNRKENHASCIEAVKKGIDQAAENGWQNVICFSGNRAGLGDEEGAKTCIEGLKQIVGYAEEKKITLCMELLNSKRNHKDYMCDHTAWGVTVCKGVGSPRMKLLYDIYHMQVQEGDVIATIKENFQYIGHFHTAGVPGRNEIDETQELDYPPIMRAIADLKYDGFVGQEFIPKRDALASLAQAVKLCDV